MSQDDSVASAAAAASTAKVGAASIAAILKSKGPAVKCVLLQHIRKTGRDGKPHPVLDGPELQKVAAAALHPVDAERGATPKDDNANEKAADDATNKAAATTDIPLLHLQEQSHRREVLTELIQEITVDTTPGNRGVEAVLGGSFTFLGQYSDEGVMLMARADQFSDLEEIDSLSVKELKALIQDNPDIVANASKAGVLLEKSDLILAVKEAQLPLNPHKLQPPFDEVAVRGDILLMRVADTPDDDADNDETDDSENAVTKAVNDFTSATAVSNEDFFLDYTAEEYIAFASRTDVVAPPLEEDDDEDEQDDDDDLEGENENEEDDDEADDADQRENGEDGEDLDYTLEDILDENDEDDRRLLLNLILGEVIKSFRAENHRGPDSEELLDLRRQVAEKLGLELPPPAPMVPDSKRSAASLSSPTASASKRVKFSPEVAVRSPENATIENDEYNDNGDEEHERAARPVAAGEDDRKMAAKPVAEDKAPIGGRPPEREEL